MQLRLSLVAAAALALTLPAQADSLGNASQAAADSAEASTRIVAAGGQIAMGAVAIPLAAAGAIAEGGGQAATKISDDLWETANTPLKIDDRVIVAQPAPIVPRIKPSEPQQ
ncbi:MAG: hypothetical protein AAF829_03785 [Pseudomonadota bacterium]